MVAIDEPNADHLFDVKKTDELPSRFRLEAHLLLIC